ncbi:MAG: beta-hydroxyacyl-ACP dehydratase [Clostridiales bacterium]|jgi:3-hydroxyacyl-[acyl-carrier-protein] dehydratase|nr:beta-hydroxyacyl-ACP dehydratase [Clostridiales bacterium]
MDREQIKNILPHREPMLLLDSIELENDISVGKYTVRGDEFFLSGHFPGNPIVPGVILCEMMAQSSCLLIDMPGGNYKTFLSGLNDIKIRNTVVPGDTVTFKCERFKSKGMFHKFKCAGYVEDKLCISGEITCAVIQ